MGTIKIGLSGLSPMELINKAQILVEKMTLNNHFPNPEPSIAVLAARKDILADCILRTSFQDRSFGFQAPVFFPNPTGCAATVHFQR